MSFKSLFLSNDYRVTVSTGSMSEKAAELESLVGKLDSVLMQAAEVVKRTDTYWSGGASEIVRAEAEEGVRLAVDNHKRLMRETENLKLITVEYQSVERKNTEDSAQLPSSILS